MRVLHCIYDDPANPWVGGGGAVRLFEIYRRIAKRLGHVTIATGSWPGARDEEIEGIHYVRLGARNPYAWSRLTYARAATRLLKRGDYDVAVFDFSVYTPLGLPSNRAVGVTVTHLLEDTARERWGRIVGKVIADREIRTLKQARVFAATSQATIDRLRALLGPDIDVRLIQAGVPDHLFAQPHRELDYVLFFGRVDWFQTGLDVLLDAMKILVHELPRLRLKIAGRGTDGDRVRDTARALGIDQNVEILGPVDDTKRAELLAGARVFLMPSRFEGFGLAAAEAMAAGVPVIASDAGSLPEVVDAPRGGIIVPRSDARALADATHRLLRDSAERSRLSDSARVSAERFRWDRIADQHLAFLTELHQGSNDE
jgi:glycosyltransferase involved in cell wall biosynthesis